MSESATTAVCPVCSLSFSGNCAVACRACNIFFYRYAKVNRVFICKKNQRACAQDALKTVSAHHICKKCRLERCLKEGMRINVDPDSAKLNRAQVDNRLPLISRVVAALRELKEGDDQNTSNVIMGTSEPGSRYLTTKCAADAFIVDTKHFRLLLDRLPIIGGLKDSNKDYFFKKTFGFHYMLLIGLNNRQMEHSTKLFIVKNMYVDLNEAKMLQFAATFAYQEGAAFDYDNYIIVARLLLNHFRSVKSSVVLTIADSIKTEEDIAAFILLIIIQANNFDVDPAKLYLQQDVNQLKAVWTELDLYYTTTRRDPSTWGNLLLFLSSMQTANIEYMKVVNAVNDRIKRAVHYRLTDN